ncbi:MAG: hypothetical protein QGG89_12760, partial [Vicinamibacterales bacterium]|nr:hypothetical protein [Vicinamibacterales bacterium]
MLHYTVIHRPVLLVGRRVAQRGENERRETVRRVEMPGLPRRIVHLAARLGEDRNGAHPTAIQCA